MLLSFSVEGFKCLAEEATLSFAAKGLRTNIPRAGQTWTSSTERVAAIYGANAAGKSTVLEAISALSRAIRTPGLGSIWQPSAFNLGTDKHVVKYGVEFIADDILYEYIVKVAFWGVCEETLYSYPVGKRRLLFSRSRDGLDNREIFNKGVSLTGPTMQTLKITKKNALFLAVAQKYGHPELTPIARALMADIGITMITFRDRQDRDILRRVLLEMLDAPDSQIDLVSGLLKAGDLGIINVEIQEREIPERLYEKVRSAIETLRDGGDEISDDIFQGLREVIVFTHEGPDNTTFTLPMGQESAGTLTWLTTAWHALNALRHGSVLLIDELDASLHPELARYIVQLFMLPQVNTKGAQLVFTSHDVSLLNNAPTRALEDRNVWFVEKDVVGRTELFSLADFDNRAGNNNERRYLAGQFGAVPDIDDTVLLKYLSVPESTESTMVDAPNA